MLKNASRKILIVAAETSSSLYAQRLLEHWRAQGVAVEAFGIGSRDMEKLGFECLGRSEELAVVGIQEVLSHWGIIKKAFHDLLDAVAVRRPDVVLLLDYPDFNLRLAKKIKKLGVPVVYYISPQIWAWRQGRVHLIRRIINKMLVLFPFEVDFYSRYDVRAEFVGHPLLDELSGRYENPKERLIQRQRFGIADDDVLVGLMPGSRRSEIKHHLNVQIETARKLADQYPKAKFALLVAPNFSKEELQSQLDGLDFPFILIKAEPFEMINMTDVVLCASGTATLMVGLMKKPMVVMYKMSGFTAFLARRFVTSTAHFGLINLVIGRRVVPEVFQEDANADKMAELLKPWMESAEKRQATAEELAEARHRLGDKGATVRVAEALEEYWSTT